MIVATRLPRYHRPLLLMSTTPETSRRSPIGTWLTIAGCAIFVFVWLFILRPSGKLQQPTKQPGVGQPLLVLELQPLTGDPPGVSLENLRGKVTLINYWGTWCPPCIAEFPHMVELWDELRGNPKFPIPVSLIVRQVARRRRSRSHGDAELSQTTRRGNPHVHRCRRRQPPSIRRTDGSTVFCLSNYRIAGSWRNHPCDLGGLRTRVRAANAGDRLDATRGKFQGGINHTSDFRSPIICLAASAGSSAATTAPLTATRLIPAA